MDRQRISNMHKIIVEEQDVSRRICEIIADRLDVPINEVTPEASFTDDLGADSLDQVELIMAMEEEFDISVPDEDAETLLTVGNVLKYVSDHT